MRRTVESMLPFRQLALSGLVLLFGIALSACDVLPRSPAGSAPVQRRTLSVPPKESPEQEAQRIRSQREKAQRSGVVVLSAGSHRQSGIFALLVEPVNGRQGAQWIRVNTDCSPNCLQRRILVGGRLTLVNNNLVVTTIAPGRWRLVAALFGRREKRFADPALFEVKQGFATYLGAFIPRSTRNRRPALQVYRHSAIQQDLTYALSAFPQTRGRRMMNTVSKLRIPALMK